MMLKRITLMFLLLGVMLFAVGSVTTTTTSGKCQGLIIGFTGESPPVIDKDVLGFSTGFEMITDATITESGMEQGQDYLSSQYNGMITNTGWTMNEMKNDNLMVAKNDVAQTMRNADWRIELSSAVRIDRQNDAFCSKFHMDYVITKINPAGQRAAPINQMMMPVAMTTNTTVANSKIIPNKVCVHQVASANIWQSQIGKSIQTSEMIEEFSSGGPHSDPAIVAAVNEKRRYPNPFA